MSCPPGAEHPSDSPAGPPADPEAGIALLFALVFVMLIGAFSLVLLSQLTGEVSQTQFAIKHQQTLNSASAGLETGLNRIRNAIDSTTGIGVIAYLPCTIGSNRGSLAGNVDAQGALTWKTDMYFLTSDPATMTTSQVNANALPCPLTVVPTFAYLISTGHQKAIPGRPAAFGDRTVHATYAFSTSNATGVGGQMVYGTKCWDVGSAPAIGTRVTFQPCQAAGTPAQSWYYRPDLSLLYQGNPGLNLCLDYRSTATVATVYYLTLQACIGSGKSGTAYNSISHSYPSAGQQYQEFSSNNVWFNVLANGDRGTGCVSSYSAASNSYGAAAIGDPLAMTSSCSGSANIVAAAAVGSGGAGGVSSGLPGPTQQLVNLANFSRCLDVYGSTPSSGLISYPCHQAPDPGKIEGNQQYQYYGTTLTAGAIQTVRSGFYSTVCLQSSGVGTPVQLLGCVSAQANQQWTMTGNVAGHYGDSFLIRDYLGNCLTALTPGGSVGSIALQTCNGGDAQKWNAPPGGAQSQLRAVEEP